MSGISIIICSRNKFIDDRLSDNIRVTIDCEHEIIVIDNSKGKYSIYEAYNIGIERSKNPILLFIHEDVLFHTYSWGRILLNYFEKDTDLGLIGVAGSKVNTEIPGAWWDNKRKFLYQSIIHPHEENGVRHEVLGFNKSSLFEEVVLIDGVFITMRKDPDIKFNVKLSGFHNYDKSISLDFLKKGYKIIVTNEILLEHFSLGNIDRSWIQSTLKFQRLYKNNLKQHLEVVPGRKDKMYVLFRFFQNCKNQGYKKLGFIYWIKYLWLAPFSPENKKIFKYCFNFSQFQKLLKMKP